MSVMTEEAKPKVFLGFLHSAAQQAGPQDLASQPSYDVQASDNTAEDTGKSLQRSEESVKTKHQPEGGYQTRRLRKRLRGTTSTTTITPKASAASQSMQPCSETTILRQNQGSIVSPSLSMNNTQCEYAVVCSWFIEVEAGHEVSLSFPTYSTGYNVSNMTLNNDPLCVRSPVVRLFDGSDQQAPNIVSFCNSHQPSSAVDFRSSGNRLYVTLETPCSSDDGNQNHTTEFRAEFHAVSMLSELIDAESPSAANGVNDCPCGRPAIKTNLLERVIDGSEAAAHSWPWQISLRGRVVEYDYDYVDQETVDSWYHKCGGSLINSRWVLTAAHCFMINQAPLGDYRIVLGDHSLASKDPEERWVRVEKFYVHEAFSRDPLINDIALVRLAEDVTFNEHVRPICLSENAPTVDMFCVISGWGLTRPWPWATPDELHQVRLPIQPIDVCRSTFTKLHIPFDRTDGVICAGYTNANANSCYGDSGGPLACFVPHSTTESPVNGTGNAGDAVTSTGRRWTLYGIVSGGAPGCNDDQNYPGDVYTNVYKYRSWIQQTMAAFKTHPWS